MGLVIAGMILLAGMGVLVTGAITDRPSPVQIGMAAPKLNLTDIDGRAFDLVSLRGQTVVLFFGS